MELYLLRHGRSLANERQLVCGAANYPLSDIGVVQAMQVAIQLGSIAFSRVYSSPLSRALDTAAELVKKTDIRIDPRLQELDTGDASHITLPELWAQDSRFRKPWLSPDLRYPGGETFREMVTRISVWFDMHLATWTDDEKVLIVGHEGTLRSIYTRILAVPLEEYPDFPIGNCDHLYFELENKSLRNYKHVRLQFIDGAGR